jgi:hypothetical protein
MEEVPKKFFDTLLGYVSENRTIRTVLAWFMAGVIVIVVAVVVAKYLAEFLGAPPVTWHEILPFLEPTPPPPRPAIHAQCVRPGISPAELKSIESRDVVVKYFGTITREQVDTVIKNLRGLCWNVHDIDDNGSGESQAAQYHNQVIYRSDADLSDAQQLADDAHGIYKSADIPVPRDGVVAPVSNGSLQHKDFILYLDNS